MAVATRLLEFFRSEINAEAEAGFPRLSLIPDTQVRAQLAYDRSLSDADRTAFRDCCAHWASASYGFVVSAPPIDHTKHPFFERWRASFNFGMPRSVPLLRAAVQQYKMDAHRGVRSCISEELFAFASSVRSVKAPELRKRVRAALKPLGYYRIDERGSYRCRAEDREFLVHVDYGGRSAQLRYSVALPEFSHVDPLIQFCFERALGFSVGDWDYIVEENVDDAMALFADVIRYCLALPDRIRAEVA